MLLITEMRRTRGRCRMELQGRLVGPWVDELRRVTRETGPGCDQVVLDVSDLSFVDRGGVALLRELTTHGIHLDGVTPYIAALLESRKGE